MRFAVVLSGLAAVASAQSWSAWSSSNPATTTTSVVTSSPTVSATPSSTWVPWSASSSTVSPIVTSNPANTTWAQWTTSASSTVSPTWTTSSICPSYTGTAPPSWVSVVPAMSSKWATGVPSDWCSYSYTQSPAPTTTISSQWTGPTTSATVTSSVSAPISTFTGAAATMGAGSFNLAGMIAAAALALA